MVRYQHIKEKIHANFNLLPKNQKKIAEFIIENFDRVPFLNVSEISEATSASVASVVRFAQNTGFSGFSELKNSIAESLQNQISNKEIFPFFEKGKEQEDLLMSVASLDIKNINDTLNMIERDNFNKAVELILKSRRVFTAGLGISYLLAEILAYQLTQVAVESSVFKHTHAMFHEQIIFLDSNDLIITFSFPPYSKETIDAAKYAHSKNIKIISITNKSSSPVTFHSDVTLLVKSENMLFTNSFAAISVLINAIATQCAFQNKAKAKKILKESIKIMEDQDQIII
jgi:DNA-binding MurR/RpiR family transcriptional regulator